MLRVAVVRDGSPGWFFCRGFADVGSMEPITEYTVFRIGSITTTLTATAAMQLSEQGLVDLDARAGDYLRTFRLVPADPRFRPTVRDLLTHTAGVGYWRRLPDLLRPGVGSADRAARSGAQPFAEYYLRGLPVMRATIGAGIEVMVRGRHLVLKPLHPIPAIRRGMCQPEEVDS